MQPHPFNNCGPSRPTDTLISAIQLKWRDSEMTVNWLLLQLEVSPWIRSLLFGDVSMGCIGLLFRVWLDGNILAFVNFTCAAAECPLSEGFSRFFWGLFSWIVFFLFASCYLMKILNWSVFFYVISHYRHRLHQIYWSQGTHYMIIMNYYPRAFWVLKAYNGLEFDVNNFGQNTEFVIKK